MDPNRNQGDRHWAIAWTAWLVYFAVVERAAIRSGNRRAPLSYYLRHALGMSRKPWHKRLGQFVAGGGIVWLLQHLAELPKD